MSVDISVNITEDVVDIIATPTVNIVNVTNSASIDPGLYDLSQFTNTSINPFVRTSGLSAYVPTTRTLTINGTTQDLSADRTFTVSTGITIGTTAITSGTVGRVLFEGTGNVVQESGNLFWDNTNGRLGVNTSTPAYDLELRGARFYHTGKTTTATTTLYNLADNTTVNNSYILFGIDTTGGTAGFGISGTYLSAGSDGTGTLRPLIIHHFKNQPIIFANNNAERMRIAPTSGNLLINTTTDAGYKLDVNGTARVQGNVTMTSGTSLTVGNIQIFDDTGGARVIQTLANQSLLIRAGGNTVTLSNSAGSGNAVFSTTGVYNFRPNGAGGGVNISAITTDPSSTTLSFSKLRNDGVKSAIINTEDFAVSGSTPLNLFVYAGKETISNTQANLILAHDGTNSRGNVGIGTSSPAQALDINGSLRIASTPSAGNIIRPDDVGVAFQFGNGVNTTYGEFRWKDGGGADLARLVATGNFLLNTTTDAGYKLDVNGTARVATSILVGSGSGTGTVQTGVSRATYFNSYSNSHTIFEVKSSGNASFYQGAAFGTTSDCVASAQVQIDSTTRGFLCPRMTTTQINAIASPAEGLQIYNTTISHMCVYQAGSWVRINHSPM